VADKHFYFGIVAIVALAFFGLIVYTIYRQSLSNVVTTADIQKAREIVRRLESE
jgi:hypothetical protein